MRTPWGLVALLVLVMTISFIDRGNLSVAAPAMVAEVGLSAWAMGVLLSAFFWTYALFQIVSGWLSDRFEVRWVYAVGFLVWTVATFSTGLVSTFAMFLVLRLFLGIGESVTYPATSRILAAVVPENRRGLANSLVDLGARVGPAAGIFLGATLLNTGQGWRAIFFLTGSLGVLWLLPWMLIAPKKLAAYSRPSGSAEEGLNWSQLLRSRSVWGTCGGLCGANYAWYFLLTWLPTYLVKERHVSLRFTGVSGGLAIPADGRFVIGLRRSCRQADFKGRFACQSEESLPRDRPFIDCGLHAGRPLAARRAGDSFADDCMLLIRDLRVESVRVDPGIGRGGRGGAVDWIAERMRQPGRHRQPDVHRLDSGAYGDIRDGVCLRRDCLSGGRCELWPAGGKQTAGPPGVGDSSRRTGRRTIMNSAHVTLAAIADVLFSCGNVLAQFADSFSATAGQMGSL